MEPNPDDGEDDQCPVQLSIEIHRRRVTKILNLMIEKLSIGCCLQQLKGAVDHTQLTPKQYSSIMKMDTQVNYLSGSVREVRSAVLRNRSKKVIVRNNSQEFTQDAHTSDMISMLHHNPEVMRAVNELMADMSPEDRQFIDEMIEFKDYALELLYTTSAAERAYNKRIGQAYVNNENYKAENAEMQKIHNSIMQEENIKINEKKNIISDYKKQIKQSHDICMTDLHLIVNDAEKAMAKDTTECAAEQEILGEELKNISIQNYGLLEGHLRQEKTLRTKRYKVETVLAGWLAKFDQDIGELQEKLEEQQNAYNAEKAAYDDLSERAEIQRIEHERLMTEKAEVEQAEFDRKRYLFIANRSARIIQRWWRKIYYKFFVKKKPKKPKKGKRRY